MSLRQNCVKNKGYKILRVFARKRNVVSAGMQILYKTC